VRVRQSSLKLFGDCARQYYYSRVLNLGDELSGSLTVLGTVFHYAVEVYENYGYNLELAKSTFDYYWRCPEQLGERIDFWHRRSTYDNLRKRAHTMLERYHALSPWKKGKLVGTEVHFIVPLGDHELEGTIDKLFMRPGIKVLEIIDFKTSAKVPEKLSQNVQFSAYCYATERPEFWDNVTGFSYDQFIDWKRQGWWFHARNGKMFNAGYRTEEHYKRLLLAVNAMDEAIKKEVFPLTISGESCGYCPFADGVCGSEVSNPTEVT